MLYLEDNGNKTDAFDDMLRSKEAKDIDAFSTGCHHQSLDIYNNSQSWYELPEKLFETIVVGSCCFHKH